MISRACGNPETGISLIDSKTAPLVCLCSPLIYIANNMNPDQTAPGSSLIRVCIVCFHEKIWSEVCLNVRSMRRGWTEFSGENSGGKRVN